MSKIEIDVARMITEDAAAKVIATLSEENRKDFNEIPEEYIKGIEFHFVKQMTEVLNLALLDQKIKHPLVL